MMQYTGYDRTATGKRPGVERFIGVVSFLTGNGLWNNGSWGVRDMRGKPGKPSVHATGRAVDLSWRKMGGRGSGSYTEACVMVDALVANAALFDLEMVIDYFPAPHGRGWRCDRQAWQQYSKPTVSGAPRGDWFHLELGNRLADDPDGVDVAFRRMFGQG